MGEKPAITAPFRVLRVVLSVIYNSIVGVAFRPEGWSYGHNLKYKLLQALVQADVFKYLEKPGGTLDKYRAHMKSVDRNPDIVMLDEKCGGGWIGNPKAKNVLVYFHGGAYILPANPMHVKMMDEIVDITKENGTDLAAFIVQYSLTPKDRYPTQLIEAAKVLHYLLDTASFAPSNIFLAGDSAGGNLVLMLLSHLSHPHPEAMKIDLKGEKLGGTILLCPWVTFKSSSASITSNLRYDYVNNAELMTCARMFVRETDEDEYNVPLMASPEWWKDLPVKDVLVIAGAYEIFLDDIKEFTKKLQVHNPQTELFVAPYEVHVEAAVAKALGDPIPQSEKLMRQWIQSKI